jgi:E3 ubiquitin-protein ligase NEDD4
MLTKELKKSNDNLAVHGKIIIYLSTNISTPIQNPGHAAANSPALNAPTNNPLDAASSSANLAGAGSSLSSPPPPPHTRPLPLHA